MLITLNKYAWVFPFSFKVMKQPWSRAYQKDWWQ